MQPVNVGKATFDLEIRRQQIVRELARINGQIAQTQEHLACMERRLATLDPTRAKAA